MCTYGWNKDGQNTAALKSGSLWPRLVLLSGQSTRRGARRLLVSQSGHLPGTWERQLTEASLAHQCFSPSLSPSLPLSLKIGK